MHNSLLALAPDSLSSLGDLDSQSLSELWAVFTRCKDSLQNGRRLENLSWRLWFDSGRRDPSAFRRNSDAASQPQADEEIRQKAVDEGWSDPEWEETSDSESDEDREGDRASRRSPDAEAVKAPSVPHQPSTATTRTTTTATRGRTTSVPAATTFGLSRPAMVNRNPSKEWRNSTTISGDSLQRMITDASILPAIALPQRPRSVVDVPVLPCRKPPLGSRGNSAPDHLNTANSVSLDSASSSSETPRTTQSGSPTTKVPAPASVKSSPPPVAPAPSRPQSPTLTRTSASSTAVDSASDSPESMPPPPVPARSNDTALPGRRRSSVKLARAPSGRKTKPSPSTALPIPSDSSSAQLARVPSEVHLQRNLSSAEVAASFKPRSFVSGFEVCSPPSQSAPRPQVGRIAPPPTPAGAAAVLAESPPKSRAHSTPVRETPLLVHDKVPAPTSSTATAAQPAPSALKMAPKPPGASKKIFFISSPNSESDDEHHSAISKESVPPSSLPNVGSPLQQTMRPAVAAAKGKGKAATDEKSAENDDDDEWDDEDDDDDDASSGWGSEYSTDSDVARNSTANAPTGGRPTAGMMGRSKSAIDPQLFAKRPPSTVHLSPSMSDMGGPGELKRRPPGLLSQLFHPDQFVDDDDDDDDEPAASAEMKRRHKSMSSLSTMVPRDKHSPAAPAHRPRGVLGDRLTMTRQPTFTKKGRPEDVELESSSDEEEDESAPNAVEVDETAAALARRQRLAEFEQAAALAAPPQTPRTTRRAMLATELSESLRRNLLWERQTRNRVMGGAPRAPIVPGQTLPQRPSSAQLAPPPSAPVVASDSQAGLRAPHPSPANPPPRPPPPASTALPRRATVATDLSRASQFSKARDPDSASESEVSDSDDDEDGEGRGRDPAGDMYTATAFGRGVW
ncbi:hypothetical protein JCM10212_005384 [Sporobolomyces blumeae]